MEHLTDRQVIALRTRSARVDEAFAWLAHAGSCAVCSERVMSQSEGALQIASFNEMLRGSVAHLSLDEMNDMVDGSLLPQEAARMNEHLAACSSCSAHLLELREEARPVPAPQPLRQGFAQWVADLFTVPRMAGAVAILLLAAALSSWVLLRQRAAAPEIASGPTRASSTSGREATPKVPTASTDGKENTRAKRRGENGSAQGSKGTKGRGSILAIALMPGIVRGEGSETTVHVPAQVETVLLTLTSREELTRGRYRVGVTDASGHSLWQHEAVYNNSPDALAVRLPAKLLAGGRYTVELSVVGGNGEGEPLEEYAVTIVK